ncbi:nuclear transport factor 2 family protein [Novosphingobium pentaromativorans]|uniref:SnoaL-like domain-containing protein n=1 Tax=Novosphingobium pentaromativorans US6-1 TaxID=1088721 RepID=G6E865_9SPHN|nr:nuclear transport factor 2 family protein [Novosphingobium pentaromativorans]EHJ62405.1 hypothetical protein NSU_0536 [Novosphingobium pentaromativorans US6-1]
MAESMNDKDAIRELISDYAAAACAMDPQELKKTFTDDAKVVGMAEVVTPGAGPLVGAEAISSFIGKAWERNKCMTQFAQPAKIVVDGDTATGVCDIVEYGMRKEGDGVIFVVGRYYDQFKKTVEGWRFSERKLEFRIYKRLAEMPK